MTTPRPPKVKICGITTPALAVAAAEAGADMIGLVHFPQSPRHLTIEEMAAISSAAPTGVERVVLTVDAGDATLDAIIAEVAPHTLQLHGAETPQRSAALAERYGVEILKAIGVSNRADVARAAAYDCAILFDAKPPKHATRPGGLGTPFDWTLLPAGAVHMLSGGLTAENVADAVSTVRPQGVDVSSGVETGGRKDPAKMRAFVQAATLSRAEV